MTNGEMLDGWKAIAEYLGKSIKTIQRWEQASGLPVHRVPGQRSVFALKSELDAWLMERKSSDGGDLAPSADDGRIPSGGGTRPVHWLLRPHRVPSIFWLLGLVFISLWAVQTLESERKPQARTGALVVREVPVGSDRTLLQFADTFGHSLLEQVVPFDLSAWRANRPGFCWYKVCDVNADGLDDVTLLTTGDNGPFMSIWLQQPDGSLREQQPLSLRDRISYEETDYPITKTMSFCWADLDGDGQLELAVLLVHDSLYPSVLKVLRWTGEPILTLEHPGCLWTVQVRRSDGRPILYVSGTNNFITTFSEPVVMRLEMDWHRPKPVRFSLLRPGRRLAPDVPTGVSLTYARLGSFPVTRGVSIWEPAVLRHPIGNTIDNIVMIEAGYYKSKMGDRSLVDGSPTQQVRLFGLKLDLSLQFAEYNDLVVQTVGFDPDGAPYGDLLRPRYWNGTDWQDTVCAVPER